ncbi:hypothetical protein C8T65DRAFT_650108 [Cerioporus squamosus]|nr:hypothetical protein C8T65DRAFT_650108 [Cerioporus squamosus]
MVLLTWTPLIHALALSLQWLIVRTGFSFSRKSTAFVRRSYASFFDGLQECTILRSLTIGQVVLCPLRLQHIVRLDFGLFDLKSITVAGCDWLWERLLRALCNRENYPHARRLMLQVYIDTDLMCFSEEGSRRMERRWQRQLARHLETSGALQLTCEARMMRGRWFWTMTKRPPVTIPDGQAQGREGIV